MEDIKEIYDGLSILLVFVTILMSAKQNKADNIINGNISSGKLKELKNQLKDINKFIKYEWMVLLIINAVMLYILTPIAIEIMMNSTINLVQFNISKTIYCFIYMIMIYFTVTYLYVSYKLYDHKCKIQQEIEKCP